MKEIIGVIGLVVAVLGFIFGGPAGLLSFIGTLLTGLAGLAVLYGIWRLVYWIGEKIVETFQWLWHCSVAGGIVVRHPHGNRMSSRPKPILSLGASDGEGCRIRRPGAVA